MMWLMMRGQHHSTQPTADPQTREELNRLRAEVTLLKQDRAADRDGSRPGPQASA
jgi:hypothetical protein